MKSTKYNNVAAPQRLLRSLLLLTMLLPMMGWAQAPTEINTLAKLKAISENTAGSYIITADIDASDASAETPAPYTTIASFSGTLEASINPATHMPYRIKNLSAPLFTTLTGTVKNLVLEDVAISDHSGNTGAIACTANVAARIYNVGILSGSVGGTAYTGGLVGFLDGTARVVNCYSYANITGGSNVGGIVGYNNATTTASSINTMVMNCMFYGDITGGSTVSPVYGGIIITNLKHKDTRSLDGLNTFNFYAYDKLKTKAITNYQCALAVEERYLVRFEIHRQLLNSNKSLAAYYATGSKDNGSQVLKWVFDKSIAPYPILKAQGKYTSIINYDTVGLADYDEAHRNQGRKTGTLTVTIKAPDDWTNAPSGAKLLDASGNEITTSRTLTLVRTDKDTANYNFNYDKVQLPYYNDYGTKNYTGNRVVTGWKITSITGGTAGTYTASDTWGGYNFADRKCTNKDLYGTGGSNRVFSQGAYYDVPYGVTAITIEPYWAKAAYVADEYLDIVNTTGYSAQSVTQLGKQFPTAKITVDGSEQDVKTSISNALGTLSGTTSPTVYDYAVVLVGNLHHTGVINDGNKPFTLMSIDLDKDNEPDCSLIYHGTNRHKTCPLRFDFLNIPGTAQAQKPTGTTAYFCNASVFNAYYWFEITNTCLIYFSQFEYENSGKTAPAPIILLGGVYDQFVSTKVNQVENTTYLHVGGNAWFHDFANGTHSDGSKKTKHIPISVTGGDFEDFHLTGTYNADAAVYTDDAECYISGGHFVEAAGAGQEQINGNVRWQIYDADIENFYGGGINDNKPIQGNITVDIVNSHVGVYCGGPKFGNMVSGKKVTTTATGCTFGKYFGAGFGGNSISKKKYFDHTNITWSDLEGYYTGDRGKYYNATTTSANQRPDLTSNANYGKKGFGVAVDFDYEFFVWTSGAPGARLFVKFAAFSLAQCNSVSSTLKHCTITDNFYGGGSLGKVVDTAYSILDSCSVTGNVYGAGFSATLPQVPVRNGGFKSSSDYPNINKNAGIFESGVFSDTTNYDWKQVGSFPANGTQTFTGTNDSIITTTFITKENLGSVGTVTVTLKGNTIVGTETSPGVLKAGTGNVYGGGDESAVTGNTTVILEGGATVLGNVYGGGNNGTVGGNSEVKIQN